MREGRGRRSSRPACPSTEHTACCRPHSQLQLHHNARYKPLPSWTFSCGTDHPTRWTPPPPTPPTHRAALLAPVLTPLYYPPTHPPTYPPTHLSTHPPKILAEPTPTAVPCHRLSIRRSRLCRSAQERLMMVICVRHRGGSEGAVRMCVLGGCW